jgi:hypothetical protein
LAGRQGAKQLGSKTTKRFCTTSTYEKQFLSAEFHERTNLGALQLRHSVQNRKEELVSASAQQDQDEATRQLALDIYKQLIGINTNPLSGQRNRAYEAFAKRFCDAEFPESDISVLGPNDRKKNIVVCPVGSEEHKPMLLIEHLDATHGGLESFARGADVDHALRSTPFYADHWQR